MPVAPRERGDRVIPMTPLPFLALAGAVAADAPQDAFFESLRALCGRAYEGRVVSTDATDRAMTATRLIMHVRSCTDTEIRIPFHVGENRSRTWVVTRTQDGLRLKHDHRHEDGSEDALTQYGGDSVASGSATRQEFPADRVSREMFVAQDLHPSVTNIWTVEVSPGRLFAYELRRPGRFFRVEFDLTQLAAVPPPPWGAE
ncbi:hypothetical protein RCO27_07245 [Sphingosinicella sp. LHD-64]|uniref:hypothetical protein n=1 Tax=Sphingosinicella sp. LHD-64 TaxID=3072139 RepID=UPI00280E6CD2|nr:hypothetical protein [Sphingosinicella sp. LHD-64]MDQ8756022.1 hypothetical protein [Sphingosinicella sp. LHD-64]